MLAAGVEAQLCAHAARIGAKEYVRHRDETPSASPRAAHRHSATPPAVHTETRARPGAAAEFVLNLCASYEPVAVVRSKPHYWGQGMVRHVFPTVVGDTWADARRAGSLPRGSAVHVACHLPTSTIRQTRQRDATQRNATNAQVPRRTRRSPQPASPVCAFEWEAAVHRLRSGERCVVRANER